MNLCRDDLLLYAVTDRSWLNGESLCSHVERALIGGVTCVQLREKSLSHDEFLEEALDIRQLCTKYHVPFIVNDNVEVAVESRADGVHVGQNDMSVSEVRAIIGPDKIVGVSVQTVEQAVFAQMCCADYLGAGAVFATDTKPDAVYIELDTLKRICKSTTIPVIAIGGINVENIDMLRRSGIVGVAVVSAVFAQNDIKAAANQMKILVQNAINSL